MIQPDVVDHKRHYAEVHQVRSIDQFTQSNQSVKIVYDQFVSTLMKAGFAVLNEEEIKACILFAAEKHQHQVRKDANKTPYIIHPIGVALTIIKEAGIKNPDLLMIALLHDTVEDTDTTFEELSYTFSPAIADAVKELSDEVGSTPGQKTQDQATRKRLEIEHAGKMTFGATVVKLSDKLYNLRDMIDHPPSTWENKRFLDYADFVDQIMSNIVAHQDDKKGEKDYEGLLILEQLVEKQIAAVREKYQVN